MKKTVKLIAKIIWTAGMIAAINYQLYLVIVLKSFGYTELALLSGIALAGTVYAAVAIWEHYE